MPEDPAQAGASADNRAFDRDLLAGASLGLFAAFIAAGWLVFTRMGHERTLNGYDLVALRYGVAAVLILPYAVRRFARLVGHGWFPPALLVLGGGFPYGLAAVWGLNFAPAGHGGALIAGTIPTFTALFAAAWLGHRLEGRQIIGLVLTLVGATAIAGVGLFAEVGRQTIGHGLFLLGAMLWAVYTVTLRRFGIAPLEATATVCVISALLYLPTYPTLFGSGMAVASWTEIAFQAIYQGVLAGVVFYIAFSRAVELLGSARGAVFLAMVPVLAALLAVPVLGEYPGPHGWFGIVAATAGVYLVTGARLR